VLAAEPGFERLRDQVRDIASALLEVVNIPAVAAQQQLLDDVAGEEWWIDVTLPMLKLLRRRVRFLVRLVPKARRRIVYTDFEDHLGDATEVTLAGLPVGTDLQRFEAKVRVYLAAHLDHVALQKLRRNRPLTSDDIAELQRMLTESGAGDSTELDRAAEQAQGLGVFIRGLVGLDRDAATDALSGFIAGRTLTANQLDFVNLIITTSPNTVSWTSAACTKRRSPITRRPARKHCSAARTSTRSSTCSTRYEPPLHPVWREAEHSNLCSGPPRQLCDHRAVSTPGGLPTWEGFMAPVLEVLADGAVHPRRDLFNEVADHLDLDETQRAAQVPSGGLLLHNRLTWAFSFLTRAGAVVRPRRGAYEITELGRSLLRDHPDGVTEVHLKEIPAFNEYEASTSRSTAPEPPAEPSSGQDLDPMEQISLGVERLHSEVAAELIDRLRKGDPTFFEQCVLDVLVAMGYGGPDGQAKRIGGTGDGGVDGVIDQDRLGLQRLYVQAKRYAAENTVGREAIQAFVGALHGRNVNQGVFITTSRFSAGANDYAAGVSTRVVLIDGARFGRVHGRFWRRRPAARDVPSRSGRRGLLRIVVEGHSLGGGHASADQLIGMSAPHPSADALIADQAVVGCELTQLSDNGGRSKCADAVAAEIDQHAHRSSHGT
jgi:restriction system protein